MVQIKLMFILACLEPKQLSMIHLEGGRPALHEYVPSTHI